MNLTAGMKAASNHLSSAILIALNINKGAVTEETKFAVGSVLEKHAGEYGSLCFVVRRPGWVLCREHGQQLTELAAHSDKPFDGFGLFGIVKETGVDDEGLSEFYHKNFKYPLYRDEDLFFYDVFFGKKKLGLSSLPWNPMKLYKGYKNMNKRMSEKGLEGNLVGEGIVKGGIILFDKYGIAKFAYEEESGSELPIDEIRKALQAIKDGKEEL